MAEKYLYSILAIILLAFLYFLTLLPLLMVRLYLESGTFLSALATWATLALLMLGPSLTLLVRKIWFFHGNGEPVPQENLLASLTNINNENIPVRISKKGQRYCISWRYDDPDVCERLERNGMKKLYELRLFLDNATKTAIIKDRVRTVDFDLCPIKVKTGLIAFPCCIFRIEIGSQWDVGAFGTKPISEYRFTPAEIKSPVMGTLLNNGWNARFTLF